MIYIFFYLIKQGFLAPHRAITGWVVEVLGRPHAYWPAELCNELRRQALKRCGPEDSWCGDDTSHGYYLLVTIEIVDLPIENGDFP